MSVVRIGATKQYSDNWENIFSGGKGSSSGKKDSKKSAKKSPKKTGKAIKKAAGKKRPVGAKSKRK
jgi:hypothetical protein